MKGELALADKLRQKSVSERIDAIFHGSAYPWVVELDPTSACNLACPDCISKDLLNQGGFTKDRLEELAYEMIEAGVKAVILIGGGEPMAHPAFGTIVEAFGYSGVHVGVTTNGTMLSRYKEHLAQHAKWVRVSMDAGTWQTYGKFRPGVGNRNWFKSVVGQMTDYAKIKTGKLGYSFLILSEFKDGEVVESNVGDIYEAGRVAKEIGCDYIEYKPSYDQDHFLIGQPQEQVFIAKEQIERCMGLADENFRVIAPVTLDEVLSGKNLSQPKEYTRCAVSELRTLITDKSAYICPYFRGRVDKAMGDLTKQSFKEMWDGEMRARVMAETDPSKECGFHCIRHQSNLILEDVFSGKQLGTVEDFDWFV